MKKYFSILCMLMLALSFNSCTSDDDDNTSWIIGEWYGKEYIKESSFTTLVTAKFKDTGKVTVTIGQTSTKMDYVVNSDNTITFSWKDDDGEKVTNKFEYEYEEDGDEAELELTNNNVIIMLKKEIKKSNKDDDDDDERGGLW